MEESFQQGDQERQQGLELSPLCDRNTVNVAKCQVGGFGGQSGSVSISQCVSQSVCQSVSVSVSQCVSQCVSQSVCQ